MELVSPTFLSTPHGALGTVKDNACSDPNKVLSTPHGALGTFCSHKRGIYPTILSTPHGALGTVNDVVCAFCVCSGFQLHTVH